MNKAVFLDRDGVINREIGNYITKLDDFELLPHALKNIKRLTEKGYKVIVVTNQGGIAKGLYTETELATMHQEMQRAVEDSGGCIHEIYYCPHHPDFGNCLCRKPGSLLVEKGLAKFHILPQNALFIGDKERDITAANGAGVEGVLIHENQDWTFVIDNLFHNSLK